MSELRSELGSDSTPLALGNTRRILLCKRIVALREASLLRGSCDSRLGLLEWLLFAGGGGTNEQQGQRVNTSQANAAVSPTDLLVAMLVAV